MNILQKFKTTSLNTKFTVFYVKKVYLVMPEKIKCNLLQFTVNCKIIYIFKIL